MGFTDLTHVQDSGIQIPHTLTHLVTSLNLSLALWANDLPFTTEVNNYFIFLTPILQFDSTVDLITFPQVTTLLAFQNFTSVTSPVFDRSPTPKTRILLYTNEANEALKGLEHVSINRKLSVYRRSKFLWFNLHKQEVMIFTWNGDGTAIYEVSYEDALDKFLDRKPVKIPNFGGSEISVTIKNFSMHSYMAPAPNGSESPWITDGVDVIWVEEACRLLNLTPVYHEGELYGTFENGTFTEGMQKDAMELRTDIVIAGVFVRPGSIGLIDVDNQWNQFCVRYMVPRPKLLNTSSQVLIVFSRDLWIILSIVSIVTSAIVKLLAKTTPAPSPRNYQSMLKTWMSLIFHLMQVRCPPRSDYRGSLAPLLLSWGWLGFLLTTIYNSMLAATFTKPFYAKKIQRTADLMGHGFTWGTPIPFEWDLLYDMTDPMFQKWVNEHHVYETEEEREIKLLTKNYAVVGFSYGEIFCFIEDKAPPEYLTNDYEVADECTRVKFAGLIFSPGSPYLEGFNLVKGRLRASGIMQKLEFEWMFSRPRIRQHITKNVFLFSRDLIQVLTFTQLPLSIYYGVFFILLCGHLISTSVFTYEWISEKLWEKSKKKTSKRGIFID